jgi:hypothetical protein
VWSTYLGGKRLDGVKGLAVDNAGAVYAGGYTTSVRLSGDGRGDTDGADVEYRARDYLRAVRGRVFGEAERGRAPDGIRERCWAGSIRTRCKGWRWTMSKRAHLVGYTRSPDFPLKNEMQNEPFWGGRPGWTCAQPESVPDDPGRGRVGWSSRPSLGAVERDGGERDCAGAGRECVPGRDRPGTSDLPAVEAPQPSFRAGNCLIDIATAGGDVPGWDTSRGYDRTLRRVIFSTFVGGYWAGDDRGVDRLKGNQYRLRAGRGAGARWGGICDRVYAEPVSHGGNVRKLTLARHFVTRMESVGEVQANAQCRRCLRGRAW